jgi:hypothetical protein
MSHDRQPASSAYPFMSFPEEAWLDLPRPRRPCAYGNLLSKEKHLPVPSVRAERPAKQNVTTGPSPTIVVPSLMVIVLL